MKQDEFIPRPNDPSLATSSFSLEGGGRLVATCLGIVVIVVGLWATLKVFNALYDGLRAPRESTELFRQWADTVGGDKLTIDVNGTKLAGAPYLAVTVIGGGTFLLCWLAMGIMLAGAKIIFWASGDREAVKKILRYALGPGRRA
ncbi:MAG TPA: hypothetical protein VMV69_04035 [Pirellulales bacterium]|nr:hypothetical protein [Pirellulales bacterium]